MKNKTYSEPKIKVAEIFFILISLQGEGLYAGVPSIFLRTFGCNFECRGFGMPKGELSQEAERIADEVDLSRADYDTLPIALTGCDSYASWHPKYKHLSKMMTIEDIVQESIQSIDDQAWITGGGAEFKNIHYVITGGEPLLGWQRAYPELFEMLHSNGFRNITFETNGTQELTDDFRDYLMLSALKNQKMNLTFSVSAKLQESGENYSKAIRPDIIASYQTYGNVYLKFVVSNMYDIDEIYNVVSKYKDAGFNGEVFLMPEGGNPDNYHANTQKVAELCMSEGYRYSPRLQVDIWQNAWGT